jgi:hypothetical protein
MAGSAPERSKIVTAAPLIALAATMVWSVEDPDCPLGGLLTLTVALALPFHLLSRLGRRPSAARMAAAALAMGYLAWGALLRFRPGAPPGDWGTLRALHGMSWYIGDRLGHWPGPFPPPFPDVVDQTMRWNWGLLAAFYAAILFFSLAGRVGRRAAHAGLRGSQPRRAEPRYLLAQTARAMLCVAPVFALWLFLDGFGDNRMDSGPIHGWRPSGTPLARPLGIIVVAGWLVMAAVRPRPALGARRLSRLVVVAATGGFASGVVWSIWGFEVGAAALFIVVALLTHRSRVDEGRRGSVLRLLAAFWGFALSVEIVVPLLLFTAG